MNKIVRISALTMSLAAALALSSCGDDSSNPVAPTPQSRVLVVHASPNAPAVDLLVDNTSAGAGLAFPNNTGYLSVNSGTRNVKVNVTGTSSTVIEADLALAPGASYTVFATDSVSKISPLVVTDNLASPAAGKAHVRFVHLSPNAPAVDVAVVSGPTLFPSRSFKTASDFTPVNAGTYNLEVRVAGTSTVALTVPGVTLMDGKIYTVFAKGFLSGSGAQALGAQIIVNN